MPTLRADAMRCEIDALAMGLTLERYKDQAEAGQGAGDASAMLKYMGTELNKRRHELMMTAAGIRGAGMGRRCGQPRGRLAAHQGELDRGRHVRGDAVHRVAARFGAAGMSKLVLTEEETMLADMARGFLDGAAPVSVFRKMRDEGRTHDAELWKQMAEMGWAGVLVPEEAGGSDMGFSRRKRHRARDGQDARRFAVSQHGGDGRDGAAPGERCARDASPGPRSRVAR